MQVNRSALISSLEFVSGALAAKETIPILSAFCFEQGTVTCFDDVITMHATTPDLGGFEGGLLASVVLPWLRAQRGEEIGFSVDKNVAVLKNGRNYTKVPILPASDFQHVDPPAGAAAKLPDLLQSLGFVAASVGIDQSHTWRLGVTLDFGDVIELLGSDNLSISVCECRGSVPGMQKKSVILPPAFVKAVLKAKAIPESWVLSPDVVGAVYDGRSVFSRTLGKGEPHKHRKVLESVDWDGFKPVPEDFKQALESCALLLSKEDDVAELIASKGTLLVRAKTDKGESETSLDFDTKKSLGIKISVKTLLRQLDGCTTMALSDGAVLLRGTSGDRMVAVLDD